MSNYDPELDGILQQDGSVRKADGISYGKKTHGIVSGIKMYWEEKYQKITNENGEEVVSEAFGIILPTVDINTEDLIVDPNDREHQIIAVLAVPDPEGDYYPHHKEVYV